MRHAFHSDSPRPPSGCRRRIALAASCVVVLTAVTSAQHAGDYTIGPQDVLSISVLNQADLGGKYAVELDGSFSFPLIGRVAAGGLTIRNLEAELTTRLANGFFNTPRVSVAIEQYRSRRVFVTGEVKNAGAYALVGDMTLIEVLAKAGSTTAAAGDEVVVVPGRPPGVAEAAAAAGESDVVRVNLQELQSGAATVPNVDLRDGDTIYVPRAELAYVYGQVRNPGSYPIRSGTTVLQALSLAGGVTPTGATNRLNVIRVVNGAKKELRIKLTDILQPGDTVVVPERFF